MRIFLSVLALALVLLIGAGGYYIYAKSTGTALIPPWQDSIENILTAGKSGVTLGSTKKPSTSFSVPQSLASAIKANRDTVAWLEVPGAEINDSVLQYRDNLYYERRDERQNYDIYGCYFMDYECPVSTREVLEPNTVIYGHSAPNDNPDGKRFSKLFRFTNPAFATDHPCIHLATEDERMMWQIFAVFYTDTSFDYIRVHISGEQMKELADQAKKLSIYDYGVEITPEDKILTLSTCSDHYGKDGTHRFVVMARLMPEIEIELEKANIVEKTN